MTTINRGLQMFNDWRLERRISKAKRDLLSARTQQDRRDAWETMAALIKQRSPQQVSRMERMAGLI